MHYAPVNQTPTEINSGLSLFLALVSGKVMPGKMWHNNLFRTKYALRTLLHPRMTLRLLKKIASEPVLRQVMPVQTMLPSKIHKPYLYLGMPVASRTSALIDHYDFVSQVTSPALQSALLSASGAALAHFSAKDGEQFVIRLGSIGRCEREGEANLFLQCGDHRLATLTFSIVRQHNKPVIIIGGLQGAHRDTPHDAIKQATKSCYGLFPKRLLLEALQLLGSRIGISRILAVGDDSHVFRSLRYRHRKKDVFFSSYNEFWQSIKATPVESGLFDIPLVLPRKSMEALPSKKRSEYKKRYLLLDEIEQHIDQVVHDRL